MKYRLFLSIALVALLFTGCKSSEKVISESVKNISGEKAHFSTLLDNYPPYASFSAKANIAIATPGGTLSSKATIRIIKDKVLQISIQPLLGIEMGRIRITPDSIFAVDKMNRRYIAEPLSSYKDRLPFDIRLASIQALFLNRPFLLGQDDLSMKDFSQFAYTRDKSLWKLSSKAGSLVYDFVTDESCRIQEASMGAGNYKMLWKYSMFNRQNDSWFPSRISVLMQGMSKTVRLDINYNTQEWNMLQNLDFSIPVQYRKMNVSDLIKALLK